MEHFCSLPHGDSFGEAYATGPRIVFLFGTHGECGYSRDYFPMSSASNEACHHGHHSHVVRELGQSRARPPLGRDNLSFSLDSSTSKY